MKAIQITQYGGRETLKLAETATPTPTANEVLIQTHYAGINFIDVYFRTGVYPSTSLPLTLGKEGIGTILTCGAAVKNFHRGDRVVFSMGGSGSYAEYACVAEKLLIKVPPALSDTQAVTCLGIQGFTAHYLSHDTYRIQPGTLALVHAAAGGTGQLLLQAIKNRGGTVIATVSTAEKATLVQNLGADHVIIYHNYHFLASLQQFTHNNGVNVVYDSIGQATYQASLKALKPRGMLVLYGQSSGKVPPLDVLTLSAQGSLYLTRPMLSHYMSSYEECHQRANDIAALIANKKLKINPPTILPLAQAATAHALLENRKTLGKILLQTTA